ncbi:carboxylating nicotinate-nucleotide diphosphorylase [Eubacteriaceae bacterium ES2]|nr:carboxylating nicotinate-nucleotide diphosphorylase [Eubacteriaceae bacterium ES2]
MTLSIEAFNLDPLLLQALKEDITSEDVTTNAIVEKGKLAAVDLICKEDGILAGIDVFARVFKLMDHDAKLQIDFSDGDEIFRGQKIATITADSRVLLTGERTALNYLQRMSGIASLTRRLTTILEGSQTKLLDTRKTTPNMRIFEKYAVKVGGGENHRFNLSDGIMIKDNHINAAGGIGEAVKRARAYNSFVRKIEVETETLEMVEQALVAGADIIMLDNMDDETMAAAVEKIGNRALSECSGNVTEERLESIKKLGVNFVSCGALTHSAKILDFSMKNLRLL